MDRFDDARLRPLVALPERNRLLESEQRPGE